MLIRAIKILKLLNTMIPILVNLRKLVNHCLVKTARGCLEVLLHPVQSLHTQRQTLGWFYALNSKLPLV